MIKNGSNDMKTIATDCVMSEGRSYPVSSGKPCDSCCCERGVSDFGAGLIAGVASVVGTAVAGVAAIGAAVRPVEFTC